MNKIPTDTLGSALSDCLSSWLRCFRSSLEINWRMGTGTKSGSPKYTSRSANASLQHHTPPDWVKIHLKSPKSDPQQSHLSLVHSYRTLHKYDKSHKQVGVPPLNNQINLVRIIDRGYP